MTWRRRSASSFAADERRWDALQTRLETIEAALDGVPDADKAPVRWLSAATTRRKRTEVIIRNRSNLEIGKLEEWRPIDCVQCSVIALRAGPVAVG